MKKILIANDHPEVVELVQVTLQGEDYQIVAASDGKEALKKVREENPDLILLDVVMPKMNGFEVCRKLKEDPETKEIPIVMPTTKPFSPSALLMKIEGILA